MVTYEELLDRDLRWALREGSLHFEKDSAVHRTLQKIVRKLDELGVPYAVAGGMALFFHGFRRFTEDVDILVTREGLQKIHAELEGHGSLPPFTGSKNTAPCHPSLASGMTNPGRVKDLGDAQELIRLFRLPADFTRELNPFVHEKYLELWKGVQGDTSG